MDRVTKERSANSPFYLASIIRRVPSPPRLCCTFLCFAVCFSRGSVGKPDWFWSISVSLARLPYPFHFLSFRSLLWVFLSFLQTRVILVLVFGTQRDYVYGVHVCAFLSKLAGVGNDRAAAPVLKWHFSCQRLGRSRTLLFSFMFS